jgi:hypothetical protein
LLHGLFCIIFVWTIIKAASALSDRHCGEIWLRGKLWSIEQERQLRKFVAEGVGIAEISNVMGKTRVSVTSKMYHLGLTVVDAAAVSPTIAVSVASIASVASTPKPIIDHAPELTQ